MRHIRLLNWLALAAVLISSRAEAAPFQPGPPVGGPAPELRAIDASGRPASLAKLSGERGLVLIFFRSAKWCPYCQKQLLEFRSAEAPLVARGYELAALSYDSPEIQAAFAKKWGISYRFLSDPKSATIDAYSLRDPQYPPGSFAYGVPKPAIFVISRHGVIEATLAEEGFKVRPGVADVIAAIDGLGDCSTPAVRTLAERKTCRRAPRN